MNQKWLGCLCASLLLCGTSHPARAEPAVVALAVEPPAVTTLYPAEINVSEEDGVRRLEKVYYLSEQDDPSAIPTADFERDGQTYTLLDILKNSRTETDTREQTEVVTLDSPTKDMAEILKQLQPTMDVQAEDGYTGTLSLDYQTIQVDAAGYRTSTRTVSAERTYPNLSNADVSLLPKSISENGRTLTLADVDWQEVFISSDQPAQYTAVASYTGTASSKYATGYTVTASYQGAVSRTSSDTIVYTAVFSSVEEESPTPDRRWMYLSAGTLAFGACAGYAVSQFHLNQKRGLIP